MNSRVIVAVVIKKDGKILLGKKPENIGPYPNAWHIPGGGVDLEKESLEEALRREVEEETGIEISNIERIDFDEDYESDKRGEMTHYLFLVFTAKFKSGKIKASDDMKQLEWVEKSGIPKLPLTRPSKRLFKKLGWI